MVSENMPSMIDSKIGSTRAVSTSEPPSSFLRMRARNRLAIDPDSRSAFSDARVRIESRVKTEAWGAKPISIFFIFPPGMVQLTPETSGRLCHLRVTLVLRAHGAQIASPIRIRFKNRSSSFLSTPSTAEVTPECARFGFAMTNWRPTPSLPQRTALECTEIDLSAFSSPHSVLCNVIMTRVPGYHLSSVTKYKPDALMSLTLCAWGAAPFQ